MPLIDSITGPEGENGTPSSNTYFFVFNWLPGFFNPFAPGDFAEKRVLKLVEWFSGHCRAIKG